MLSGIRYLEKLNKIRNVETLARSCSSSVTEGSKFSIRRRISSDDVSNYSKLTGDYNPVHDEVALLSIYNFHNKIYYFIGESDSTINKGKPQIIERNRYITKSEAKYLSGFQYLE